MKTPARKGIFRKKRRGGFSLVEVALALAIIGFSLVGIMGLIPVAMQSAQDSQRETRATLIAQQIFSDLHGQQGKTRYLVAGTNIATDKIELDLSASGTSTAIGYDIEGQPLMASNAPGVIYLAQLGVVANNPTNGLARVQATIEVPASAPATNRARYNFVTLLNAE